MAVQQTVSEFRVQSGLRQREQTEIGYVADAVPTTTTKKSEDWKYKH